ncbi:MULTISPECIES: lipase family protein [unclassified Corynebacterium]|uniref:lipase family protein n=1 Tax=unclassified Corynebacterium TaxID=2624378 RepID=UPI0029CA938D|nr:MULTISPECIES: lipase family protein [unclassified Corynebacterium]WPF66496.1 lipase family protein [Corynebacterium sp. 22KM0430]WPF68985.1 lipase family protein [Corynebacterium sp. 21KM1197]
MTAVAVALPTAPAVAAPTLPVIPNSSDLLPEGSSSIQRSDHGFFENHEDLSGRNPGDILDVRHLPYHAFAAPLPLEVVQIKYVTINAQGHKTHGITSVVKPTGPGNGKLVSMHSIYDSLNPEHSPSRSIAGDLSVGNIAYTGTETVQILNFLAKGYAVAFPDIEGQTANFIAGPEYGTTTLDGIRAALHVPDTGLNPDSQVGLVGYSGGAIATNWAAQLAPSYAPDINDNLVGAATGGVLVNPINNINYVSGSAYWAPIQLMAVVGLSRAYGVDLAQYFNDFGRMMLSRVENSSITEVVGSMPGLTWEALVKPEYRDPYAIPELVDVIRKVNMGLAPDPTVPFYYTQGVVGEVAGTVDVQRGLGKAGDGVMVADDSRALANKYCAAGVPVQYEEHPVPHVTGGATWFVNAVGWMTDRFEGKPAPSTCGSIPAGDQSILH